MIRVRTRILIKLLFVLLLLTAASAAAEQAQDVAAACTLKATENADTRKYVLTKSLNQRWNAGESGTLTVTLPEGKLAQGVMLSHYGQETAVEILDENGRCIGCGPGSYRVEWIPFEREVSAFTVVRKNEADVLSIARMSVLTPGELPDWVQRWKTLEEPAELMLVSTHPDDEILWFGGILPYYAGELRRKVEVVYMVGGLNPVRTLELLDGLWYMGVTHYPDIGTFSNVGLGSLSSVYDGWGRYSAEERIVEVIRHYRPQVVITQDVKGEYLHYAHVATVQAVIDVFENGLSADAGKYPESAAAWGTWEPLKLYIHLWKENEIRFDWNRPLDAFGGKTGLQIAKAAFKKHVSQQNSKYHHAVKDSGQYDCSRFGLYWSSVGPDEAHDDLFEHVPAQE